MAIDRSLYTRTLFGTTEDGRQIVRYDEPGKWYAESPGQEYLDGELLTVAQAAEYACAGAYVEGLERGRLFYSKVRQCLGL